MFWFCLQCWIQTNTTIRNMGFEHNIGLPFWTPKFFFLRLYTSLKIFKMSIGPGLYTVSAVHTHTHVYTIIHTWKKKKNWVFPNSLRRTSNVYQVTSELKLEELHWSSPGKRSIQYPGNDPPSNARWNLSLYSVTLVTHCAKGWGGGRKLAMHGHAEWWRERNWAICSCIPFGGNQVQ